MKPIIRWSLWDRRLAIVSWSAGIGAYIAINILVYSSISGQAEALNKALDNLPVAARSLFSDSADLLSPAGYLSSKLYYLVLPMLFTILAINISSHLLSREEQDGTLELLLSRPISRSKLLAAKLITGFVVIGAIGLATLLATAICIKASSYDVSLARVVQAQAMTILLALVFGSIAWLFVGLGKFGRRASVGIASFIALGSYLFSSLEGIASWLKWPAKLLPFHYYQPTAVINGTYNWSNAVGLAIAAIIITALAFVAFNRRDIA
jgi:ABC-2 type transport system permease protein